jgi:hypothetical protein
MSDTGRAAVSVETGALTEDSFRVDAQHKEFYANNIRAGMSPWDASLHFGVIVDPPRANPFIEEKVTVRLSPQTLKVLSIMIPGIVAQWEQRFGLIPLPTELIPAPAAIREAFAAADVAAQAKDSKG